MSRKFKITYSKPQKRDFMVTTIIISEDEAQWLDKVIHKMKKDGWREASRSALVRSLIKSTKESNINLDDIQDETSLTNRLISNK